MIGDTAIALLRAGAQTDKRDSDGYLALDLAPDKAVRTPFRSPIHLFTCIYPLDLPSPCRFGSILSEKLKMRGLSSNTLLLHVLDRMRPHA